ncbi:phage tail tape measure protein [Fictibacillus fluitans]|uniref:Phage tail tape measure protein n=1 Tax=Fictibacillus fluitans TaxID=3058422 RepID=A0ABT8HQZ4_9BACL|nr:phage tail tape measure protein [Fictibacillus sp. NE201]MDN4523179.1 phage tail tape measure protein [Fictibacillus sp. NE201]
MSDNRRIGIQFDVNTSALKGLEKAIRTMDRLNSNMDKLKKTSNVVSSSFDRVSTSAKRSESSQNAYVRTLEKVQTANKQATKSVKEFQRAVNSGVNAKAINAGASGFRNFDNRIQGAHRSMKGLNRYTLSFAEATKIAGERMIQWTVGAAAIFGTTRAIRAVINTIVELDSQLVDFQKVMDDGTNYNNLFDDMGDSADKFGRKLTEINKIGIAFAQEGFGQDKIKGLVDATALLANVGDIDVTQAQATISSLMNVYDKGITETAGLVDRMNSVTNNYAIDVNNLSTALQKSTGVAQAFGVSMEENEGFITAITTATRESGSIVGNSLKTIYSRVTTVSGAMKSLEGIGVNVFDPVTGDARKVSDILGDLHGKWDGLTNKEKQNIAIKVAGRYQVSRFLGLMNKYETAIDATKTATKSWGSAQKENERYMKSLEAKINMTKTSFEKLSKTLGDNGIKQAFGLILIAVNDLMGGLTAMFDKFGGWTWAIGAFAAGLLTVSYNFQKMRTNAELAEASMATASTRTQAFAMAMGASTKTATTMSLAVGRIGTAMKGLAAATLLNPFGWISLAITGATMLFGHFQKVKQEQKELNETAKTAGKEYKAFLDMIKDGSVDTYNIDKYQQQVELLGKTEQKLNKDISKNYSTIAVQMGQYDEYGRLIQGVKMSKDELIKAYGKETKAADVLKKAELDQLAQMGIKNVATISMAEAVKKVKDRQNELSGSVEKAQKVMEEQRLKGLAPNTEAYNDYNEKIDENLSLIENVIGFGDKLVKELKEQKAVVELLSGVKNKDSLQTQIYNEILDKLAEATGRSREEIAKNPKVIDKEIKKKKELDELTGKMADGTAKAEDKRRAQQLLSAQNAEDTSRREKQARERMEKASADAYEKKMKRVMGYNEKLNKSTKENDKHIEQNSKAYNTNAKKTGASMWDKVKSAQTTTKKTNDQMDKEKKKTDDTVKNWMDGSKKVQKSSKDKSSFVIQMSKEQAAGHKKANDDEMKSVTGGWNSLWNTVSKIWGWIKGIFGIKSSSKSTPHVRQGGPQIAGYAVGTSRSGHKGGPAIVGEEGPELAHIPGVGTTVVGARGPELIGDLPKGSSVLPNKHTEQLLKSYGFPGYAGGVGDFFDAITKGPKAVWESATSKFGLTDSLIPDWFRKGSGSPVKAIGGMAVNAIQGLMDKAIGSLGNFVGGGAKMAQAAILQALKITGKPMSWLSPLMNIAKHESGFNPRATNNWDINAKRGDPSIGLFQVIGSTFRRWALPGLGGQTNPVASAVAAIRYMDGRYGGVWGHPGIKSMMKGGGYKPYANGGMIDKPHMGLVGEAGPEMIIPLSSERRSRAMELYEQTGKMLGVRAYANGGIVGDYKIKKGDTLGELANKFNTSIYHLMQVNPQIKNANKIFAGAILKLSKLIKTEDGSYVSPGYYGSSPAKKSTPKKPAHEQEWYDNKVDWIFSYMSKMKEIGDSGYDKPSYDVWKMMDNRDIFKNAGKEKQLEYNKTIITALQQYDNLKYAKARFDEAGFMSLSTKQKQSAWKGITESVSQNVQNYQMDRNNIWMDMFNKKVKEATENVKVLMDAYEGMKDRQLEEKKNDFVNSKSSSILSALGLDFEGLTEAEKVQQKIEDIQNKIKVRAEESALLEYRLKTNDDTKRLNELQSLMDSLNARIKKTSDDMKGKGVSDSKLIAEAQEPLRDRLAEIKEEYDYLNKVMKESSSQINKNQSEMEKLAQEYKDLQSQLESAKNRREYTDVWGNILRDAEGTVAMVNAQGQTIIDTFNRVKQGISSVNQASSSIGTTEPSSSSDSQLYEANTTTVKNVQYIVNTGVSLASQSELKELAMYLKDMIDEEEGRS